MKYLVWLALWVPLFLVGVVFRILSPIACLFVYQDFCLAYVKRLNKTTVLMRDRLYLSWFDTFDNPVDEYWYGMYGDTENKSQYDYDRSKVSRWIYRIKWLNRNSAYTFNYKFFGILPTSWLNWQYQNYSPINVNYNWNINIGWKSHIGFDKLIFAGRFFGIKKNN